MNAAKQCMHEGCQCSVPAEKADKGDKYCCPYCAQHAGQPDHHAHACNCGHGTCSK